MPATTIRLYNPISDKLESVHPYSRKAKIIYRSYVEVLDWSPGPIFTYWTPVQKQQIPINSENPSNNAVEK